MAPPSLRMLMLMLVATATGARSASDEENELDYGYWNYREGADSVNVASVRSVTRVLDIWGKRIFKEIKTLLHSEPGSLLPDYSRVRPLSESLNDLFREVSLLRRRITELSHRLATLEPFLRRHGYREEEEEEEGGEDGGGEEEEGDGGGGRRRVLVPQSLQGEEAKVTRFTPRGGSAPGGGGGTAPTAPRGGGGTSTRGRGGNQHPGVRGAQHPGVGGAQHPGVGGAQHPQHPWWGESGGEEETGEGPKLKGV